MNFLLAVSLRVVEERIQFVNRGIAVLYPYILFIVGNCHFNKLNTGFVRFLTIVVRIVGGNVLTVKV